MDPLPFLIPIAAFAVVGPVIWVFVCLLLSAIGGWGALARVYRSPLPKTVPPPTESTVLRRDGVASPPPRHLWRFQNAKFRWGTNYNGILMFGVDDAGLHLSVFFLFKIGRPPLLIPWREINVAKHVSLFFKGYSLSFARVPGVRIAVRDGLARDLAGAAGSAWPGTNDPP